LSYTQRRYRLQQVSISNYKYWRDIILLGGSSSKSTTIATLNDTTDLLYVDPAATTAAATTTATTMDPLFESDVSKLTSVAVALPQVQQPTHNSSTTSSSSSSCELSSIISRLSQPFLPNMFVSLSNLYDSDSESDNENDDDDDRYNNNDTTTPTTSGSTSSVDIDDDNAVVVVDNNTNSTVNYSQKNMKNEIVTTVTSLIGRTSPTEQSVALLSEELDVDWYNRHHLNKNNKTTTTTNNRVATNNNLQYHYHNRHCRQRPQQQLHSVIGEAQ
jgi:hypothetical protein